MPCSLTARSPSPRSRPPGAGDEVSRDRAPVSSSTSHWDARRPTSLPSPSGPPGFGWSLPNPDLRRMSPTTQVQRRSGPTPLGGSRFRAADCPPSPSAVPRSRNATLSFVNVAGSGWTWPSWPSATAGPARASLPRECAAPHGVHRRPYSGSAWRSGRARRRPRRWCCVRGAQSSAAATARAPESGTTAGRPLARGCRFRG